MSAMMDTYVAFSAAATAPDNRAAMEPYVSDDFVAKLKNERSGVVSRTLDFTAYVADVDRLRRAFPDLGKRTTTMSDVVEEGSLLTATQITFATFNGPLMPTTNQILTRSPTYTLVRLVSHVEVTFDEQGKIKRLVAVTSVITTTKQVRPQHH